MLSAPVMQKYNPRPSGFTRFFERGLNQSGNRRDNRRGDFKFREGPFKGLTLGQAEERASDLYNNLDPSVKAKYQSMADSKRGFDPRGGMSMRSTSINTDRYLPDGSINPNRATDDYREPTGTQGVLLPPKPRQNSTEPDFENAPKNNNVAQNQSIFDDDAPSASPGPSPSPSPGPSPSPSPSDRGTINGMPTAEALNEPESKQPSDRGYIDGMPTEQALSESKSRVDAIRAGEGAEEAPLPGEQASTSEEQAPTSGEGARNKQNPFLKEDGSFDLDKFVVGRGGPEEAERIRKQAAQQVKANYDARSLDRELQRERIENADHTSGEVFAKKMALMDEQSKERIARGDFRPLNRRLYKSKLQNQMDDVAEKFGKESEEYKNLKRKSDRLRGKSINEEAGMFVGERVGQPGFTKKNSGPSGTFTDEESAFAREAAFKAANNPRYKNRKAKTATNPFSYS
jgi:hypothetical protein